LRPVAHAIALLLAGDNYRRDMDLGAGYHLNQASPVLHGVDLGDSLWAFTRRPDGAYVLAAELVVKAKTLNRPGSSLIIG
jgi:5-methylcytosine-specific restriction enzyme A